MNAKASPVSQNQVKEPIRARKVQQHLLTKWSMKILQLEADECTVIEKRMTTGRSSNHSQTLMTNEYE
jgi:hypothetical protein